MTITIITTGNHGAADLQSAASSCPASAFRAGCLLDRFPQRQCHGMIGRLARMFVKHGMDRSTHVEPIPLLNDPIEKDRPAVLSANAVDPVCLADQSRRVVWILFGHLSGSMTCSDARNPGYDSS